MEYSIREWEGSQTFIGPKIKIDTSKKHTLRAKFKAIGKEKSKLYFGIACYDESEKLIPAQEVYRKPSSCTVLAFTENTLKTDTQPKDWASGAVKGTSKWLGFYFDGDTKRLPDYVWVKDEKEQDNANESGIYSVFDEDALKLNMPLPDVVVAKIQKGVTKICNHFKGNTYNYSAASTTEVPDEWTEYSAVIQGEGWNDDKSKFRVNTKSIAVVILANFEQQKEAKLLMKELELSAVLYP